MPACYRLPLIVANFVFPTFSVFKVVYQPFCIFYYVSHAVVSGTHPWVALRLPDVLKRQKLSLNLLSKLVMFLILEKHLVVLENFRRP